MKKNLFVCNAKVAKELWRKDGNFILIDIEDISFLFIFRSHLKDKERILNLLLKLAP